MFSSLSPFHKFCPGAKLWFVFFEPQRSLFREINWRTGFLLQDLHDNSPLDLPILVDTQKIFPNLCLLCLPFLNKEAWVQDIYNLWQKMNRPDLRVFVPLDCDKKMLESGWPLQDPPNHSSCYVEKGT